MSTSDDYKMFPMSEDAGYPMPPGIHTEEEIMSYQAYRRGRSSSLCGYTSSNLLFTLLYGGLAASLLWMFWSIGYQVWVTQPQEKAAEAAAQKGIAQVPDVLMLMLEEMTKMRVTMEMLADSQQQ